VVSKLIEGEGLYGKRELHTHQSSKRQLKERFDMSKIEVFHITAFFLKLSEEKPFFCRVY
jgi:hypothetical protein